MMGTFGPYMSPSSTATGCPGRQAPTARFTATVRLPHTALARADGDDVLHALDGRAARVGRHDRPNTGGHLDLNARHAGQRGDGDARLLLHLIFDRARRRRQLDRKAHAAAIDAKPFDESEGDDVFVKVGIPDHAQGVEDHGLGESTHLTILSGVRRAEGRR